MRSSLIRVPLALGMFALLAVSIRAFPTGPSPGVTGGFGEETCNTSGCHNNFELNAGRKEGLGDLLVTGFPERYEVGKTYPIKLVISHTDGRMHWGFQLATRVSMTGAQAGVLKPMDGATQVLEEKGIAYIEHTIQGIPTNTFDFSWTAPSQPIGEVTMHAAGNAADGDLTPDSDYIYTTSVTIAPPGP